MRFPEDVPRLTEGQVTLRAHTAEDVPRIVEQCVDPESVAWTTVPVPYARADAETWIGEIVPEGWVADTTYVFAVEYDGRFAGSVDLRLRGGGEAEIGYGLHPDARGSGVMRRALTLLLDWAFGELGLEVVTWRAFVGNWASRRTVWALGFTVGPTIPRLLPQRGERRDAWTAWLGRGDERSPVEPWLRPASIEADGVRLRAWGERDAERLVEAGNDPVVREWIPGSPLPTTAEDVDRYLTRIRESAATNRRVAWCVADAGSDVPLGNIAVFDFEGAPGALTAQVGYWSLPAGRGRGAMTTALREVCAHVRRPTAEGGLGVRRLYLLTDVENTASRRLAERAGFEQVGIERAESPRADGTFGDSALYDLV
ncbi:GNAT N-acetyltransferase [Nocardioides rotundus]|uniref:GNAT family N-acetyltransferase n=1 Tax=Nocardioides rotundus TaxID=1774216 RepID=UPI001CC0CC5F|nr:GNAT family N-acetyltransferase [Nocardioides rotundus]UAL29047.1 GNAT N-acetyltransferase [Nocardioides rotundus]